MSTFLPKIVITSGEPSGIGPDVCLHLLNAKLPAKISLIGDSVVFGQRARQLGLENALKHLDLISMPTAFPVVAGRLDSKNVPMVLKQLDTAIEGCMRKQFHAMVTAPLHKGIINDAGHKFTGHTEYLAKKTRAGKPVMLLSCDAMRVALVTTHLPLEKVTHEITQDNLINVLEVLYNDLKFRFGIHKPVIGVCGLNPHAGEQGHLGRTEIEIIEPTLDLARESGMDIIGPLPADTAFNQNILHQVDVILCMYHDQGLPVLKYASFGKASNITLGLPIIRTSVDHGTALDLAGTGRADPGSMITAVEDAIELANIEYQRKHSKKNAHSNRSATAASSQQNSTDDNNIDISDSDMQEMFNILDEDESLQRNESALEDTDDNENILKEMNLKIKKDKEMDFESTMTSSIDKTIDSMKKILT